MEIKMQFKWVKDGSFENRFKHPRNDIFHLRPYFIQNSLPPLQQPKKAPEYSVAFLECGGETVKGVLTVPESVSTQAVVLLHQVHDAVTAAHCLLQTPFRYRAHLLLRLSLFLSFFLSIPVSSDGLQASEPCPFLLRPSHGPNLHQSDTKSHGVAPFVPHFLHTHLLPFICP